jgi:hypothetical protein
MLNLFADIGGKMIPKNFYALSIPAMVMITLLLVSAAHGQAEDYEDVVYLKNGNIIRGVILEQNLGESLKIAARDGSIFVLSMEEIARIAKEPLKETAGEPEIETAAMPKKEPTGFRRDPFLAGAMSFLIPGAGQVYNGEYGKGALHFGMFYVGGMLAIANMDWDFLWGESDDFEGNAGLAFLGSAVALGGMIWSIIDAPRGAGRVNEKNGWTVLPSVSDNLYLAITDVHADGRGTVGVRLILKF